MRTFKAGAVVRVGDDQPAHVLEQIENEVRVRYADSSEGIVDAAKVVPWVEKITRVRVTYVAEITDAMRSAVNRVAGKPGLATDDEVLAYGWGFGDAEIMEEEQ